MRNLLLVLLLLCTSCIQIGNAPPPMNYYLLESKTELPINSLENSLNIHMELTVFPEYLDRLQIVTYNGNNAINFKDNERWAEPLQDNLMQVVREDLVKSIPGSVISIGPWETPSNNAEKVKLILNQFSGQIGKHTKIDIRWVIVNNSGESKQGHFTDQQPIGDTYQDLIIGLNSGINRFSLELAKNLARE